MGYHHNLFICIVHITILIFGVHSHTSTDTNLTTTEDNSFDLSLSLDLYTNFSNSPITSFPHSLQIREALYVEISSNSSNDQLKLVVQKCYATPSSDPADALAYNIFTERCPTDSTFNLVEDVQKRLRFEVQAFQFLTVDSVFIHCESYFCLSSSSAAECTFGCPSRKRRNLADQEKGISTNKNIIVTSSGMLRILKDDMVEITVLRKNDQPVVEASNISWLSIGIMCFLMVVILMIVKATRFSSKSTVMEITQAH